MADRTDSMEFDESGVILPRDEKLLEYVRSNSGRWVAVSAQDGMLLLRRADKGGGGRVLMSGEIKREGWLVDILSFVCNQGLTGKIVVVSRDVRRELFFDKGQLRLASSTATGDLLGEFILSEGLITKEQLDAALKEIGPGKRLGQVLVDKGILTRHDIYNLLNKKVEKIFFDAIVLHDGVYTFDEDIDLSKLPASISIDTKTLLMKGLTKRDELTYYRETVPRPGGMLSNQLKALDACSSVEKDFVSKVDGSRTLAEIDDLLHLGDFETVRIARKLASKGLLVVILDKEMEADALRSVVHDFNTAIRVIYDAIQGRVKADELTELGREFMSKSTQQLEGPEKVTLKRTGEFDFHNVMRIYEASEAREKMNLIIMVLSRYISFILFTANSYLPVNEQEKLSSSVYGNLDAYS
ncbi:MAG: DUF4388 domain-containing protein [Deltaproteobacteria bacterium]|nr:DUF4388 domain-containing protein [Deltaproteobacteria bacterium]